MANDRQLPQSTDSGPILGTTYMDAVQEKADLWFGLLPQRLDSVAGTDTITATAKTPLDPTDGLISGMSFWLKPANANATSTPTLNIDSSGAVTIVDDAGSALGVGFLKTTTFYLLYYDGTNFRVMFSSEVQKVANEQTFTSSGTWTKPTGTPDDALVIVQAWGSGAGGSTGNVIDGGGGGGAYVIKFFKASDLGSTETVTIGAGGTAGNAGNSSTFGAHVTAYGGGTGAGAGAQAAGGAGGSPHGAGGDAADSGTGGVRAGRSAGDGGGFSTDGGDGIGSGGGGGGGNSSDGGNAEWAGAGGGGSSGNGGTSINGGDGGDPGIAGTAPGGGGGADAAGGDGQIIVRTIG